MNRLFILALLWIALGAIAAGTASATTALRPFNVNELTDRSTLVIRGEVERIESERQGDAIFTNIDIVSMETWKGNAQVGRVQLRVYGGSSDGLRTTVIGAPCWGGGEEAVLFLVSNGPSTYDVLALGQGKFHVAADGRLERDLDGIAFVEPAAEVMPETVPALKSAVLAAMR